MMERTVEFSSQSGRIIIRFLLKGDKGVVQFVVATDWYSKEEQAQRLPPYYETRPVGWDLGYHSRTPRYKDEKPFVDSCEFLDGAPCYYDGSGLAADDLRDKFLEGGDAVVWSELEAYYAHIFEEDRCQSGVIDLLG